LRQSLQLIVLLAGAAMSLAINRGLSTCGRLALGAVETSIVAISARNGVVHCGTECLIHRN
jgi:hypothetical protein